MLRAAVLVVVQAVPVAGLAALVAALVVDRALVGRAPVGRARAVPARRVLLVRPVPLGHLAPAVRPAPQVRPALTEPLVQAARPARPVRPAAGDADMAARTTVQHTKGARVQRAPDLVVQQLQYPGLDGTIVLENADAVLLALNALMTGWTPDVATVATGGENPDAPQPVSKIRANKARFDLHSPWLDEPLENLMTASAACGVVADISQAFCNQHRGCLGLHCGAVQINGHLVVLTGPARAGKSTLISRLTAEPDMTVFCDDILPVMEDGLAFGLGLAPRLRLPLPATVSPAFRAHVDRYMGPADSRYGYLCGPNIAPHGTRAPVSAFIVLARGQDLPAQLHRMEPTEAVQHLVRQNISAPGEGTEHFDQVTRIAENLPCLKMVYSDLEDAVSLLRRAFGGDVVPAPGVSIAPALPADIEAVVHPPASLSRRYRRSAQVAVRAVQDDLFLWHATEYSYFHLNVVARAIWTLLEEPITGAEIADTLSEVFPGADPDQIARDVAALLGAFETELLIQPDA